jgi:hypothetical protein
MAVKGEHMGSIRAIFTRRDFNIASLGIRWMVPHSRLEIAESSHVMAVGGDHAIEAVMLHGMRRMPLDVALQRATIIGVVDYQVPDAEQGIAFGSSQIGKKYDYKGAAGRGLSPDRRWQDPQNWFCYELFAAMLAKAGRNLSVDHAHVTGSMLLSVNPHLQ